MSARWVREAKRKSASEPERGEANLGFGAETFEPAMDNISMIANAKGIKPLVGLLGDGSSVAQRVG